MDESLFADYLGRRGYCCVLLLLVMALSGWFLVFVCLWVWAFDCVPVCFVCFLCCWLGVFVSLLVSDTWSLGVFWILWVVIGLSVCRVRVCGCVCAG